MPVTAIRTQATELYYANAAATVLKVGQIVGLGAINGPAGEIDITCLDSTAREFTLGFREFQDVSIPIIFNDQDASHIALLALVGGNSAKNFGIFGSQTATAPTASSSLLVRPTTRTSWIFNALVKDVTFEFETNNVIRGNVILRPTGTVTVTAAA